MDNKKMLTLSVLLLIVIGLSGAVYFGLINLPGLANVMSTTNAFECTSATDSFTCTLIPGWVQYLDGVPLDGVIVTDDVPADAVDKINSGEYNKCKISGVLGDYDSYKSDCTTGIIGTFNNHEGIVGIQQGFPLCTISPAIQPLDSGCIKTTSITFYYEEEACECTQFENVECVGEQMNQTRTCTPSGCDIEEQLVADESCLEEETPIDEEEETTTTTTSGGGGSPTYTAPTTTTTTTEPETTEETPIEYYVAGIAILGALGFILWRRYYG